MLPYVPILCLCPVQCSCFSSYNLWPYFLFAAERMVAKNSKNAEMRIAVKDTAQAKVRKSCVNATHYMVPGPDGCGKWSFQERQEIRLWYSVPRNPFHWYRSMLSVLLSCLICPVILSLAFPYSKAIVLLKISASVMIVCKYSWFHWCIAEKYTEGANDDYPVALLKATKYSHTKTVINIIKLQEICASTWCRAAMRAWRYAVLFGRRGRDSIE